jgi:hypothetical protein
VSIAFSRLACTALLGLLCLPAAAEEKEGMPDLGQIEQTCLPTAMANLIVWFGLHGYPKLIEAGDNKENGYIHTLHSIMKDTDARFDWGTRPDKIADGIKKYIEDSGYNCDVEFRGLAKTTFSPDWLKENDQPNKGFVLLLAYCSYNAGNDTYTNAWNAGHAVTLVNATPDMILVHDPAHYPDEPGRKILSPEALTHGNWVARDETAPVAGLMMLSGTMMDAPPDAQIMLIGAVEITMKGERDMVASSSPGSVGTPVSTISGGSSTPSSTPSVPSAPASPSKSWVQWLFNTLFSK